MLLVLFCLKELVLMILSGQGTECANNAGLKEIENREEIDLF